MLGKMVTNDLAESSFAGVTAQVQTYGRIDMCSAATVSDMARNGFFARPTTKKNIGNDKRGVFFTLPEELRLTAVMVAMEDAPYTRDSNNVTLALQRKRKREKEQHVAEKGLEKASDQFIKALVLRQMWDSDAACKTVDDVTNRLQLLKYKKDKMAMLTDNIEIRVVGFGWQEFRTEWSKDGKQKSIEQLEEQLKEIIGLEKNLIVLDKPDVAIPQRTNIAILGQLTH